MRTPVKTVAIALLLAAASVSTMSCSRDTSNRSGRLLTMAAEEAGFIDSIQERLTRQLNIADLQIQSKQKAEALKTLALAGKTLEVEEKDKKTLDDFRRIAGWASVAELAHQAGDDSVAVTAYYNAREKLDSVSPEARRAEYVLSLSEICFMLKGKQEAGQLLVKGGGWASKISDTNVRRYALTTFTTQLIGYDDLDSARLVMRNEPDAAWRADSLAVMARNAMNAEVKSNSAIAYESSARGAAALTMRTASPVDQGMVLRDKSREQADPTLNFNANVRYQQNYRKESLQQGYLPQQGQ